MHNQLLRSIVADSGSQTCDIPVWKIFLFFAIGVARKAKSEQKSSQRPGILISFCDTAFSAFLQYKNFGKLRLFRNSFIC